jgi:putative SOS response-associated peptidase YedK
LPAVVLVHELGETSPKESESEKLAAKRHAPTRQAEKVQLTKMINARSETLLEKPSFRSAAIKRRGLVPADGYYEWMKTDTRKVPTYLTSETDELLTFAALYEFWPDLSLPEDHADKWLATCTILTASATDALGHIHERTPVIIPENRQSDWLDTKLTDKDTIRQLLDSLPEPHLVPYEVSNRVNAVRNNGPELIEPVTAG